MDPVISAICILIDDIDKIKDIEEIQKRLNIRREYILMRNEHLGV